MSRQFLTPVILPANPTAALEAATKQYVDAAAASGGLPVGGSTNQVLAKNSATDYDLKWSTPPASTIAFTPAGTIAATNVQAAIEETSADVTLLNNYWTNYTPTISGTGWALGNAVAVARFKLLGARTIAYRGRITFGSSSTYGGSALTLSVPANGDITTNSIGEMQIISGSVYFAKVVLTATTALTCYAQTGATGTHGSMVQGSPMTFTNGTRLDWQIVYESL